MPAFARVTVCCSITSCIATRSPGSTHAFQIGVFATYLPTSYQTRLYTLDRDQQEQQRQLPNVDRQSQDPEQPQPSTQLPKTLDQWYLAQFR